MRQGGVLPSGKSRRYNPVVGPRIVDRRMTGWMPSSEGGRLSFIIETGAFGIVPTRQARTIVNVPIVVAAVEAVIHERMSRKLLS